MHHNILRAPYTQEHFPSIIPSVILDEFNALFVRAQHTGCCVGMEVKANMPEACFQMLTIFTNYQNLFSFSCHNKKALLLELKVFDLWALSLLHSESLVKPHRRHSG
jgi:hypothetical protein